MKLAKPIRNARRRVDEWTAYWRLFKPCDLKGKFFIFAQGRTGSTLLVQLLNSNPDIYCEGEILRRKVLSPYHFVKAYSHRSQRPFFGFKVKIYQLTTDQRIEHPKAFLERMLRDGWKLIYLQRTDIVRHAMSNVVAAHRRSFHHRTSQGALKLEKFRVDAPNLIHRIKLRERWLRDEAEVLNGFSYLPVHYETDLLHTDRHQETLNRVFDYLGVARATVKAQLVRTSKDKLADVIENYDEVLRAISATKYGAYLDGNADYNR